MTDYAFPVTNQTSLTLTALAVADPGGGGLTYTSGMTRLLTEAGGQTIAPGATVRVVLPGGAGGVILADAGSLLPVAGRIFDLKVTPAVSLTPGTADTDAMGHALDLVRNTMAAPTSILAVDLAKALADAGAAADDAAADAIMQAFFASHPPYESVTEDRYSMMLSWVQRYAYLWSLDADGRPGRVFDLQPSPYFGVNGTSLGTIAFSAPAGRSAVADPEDTSSGLTIRFTPADGAARSLAFALRGLGDGKGLALLGTFCDPSWVATGSDAALLVPVFAGTLDGKTVIAVPATATTSDGSANSGLSGLDIANLVIGIIGLISSLVTIWMGVYAFKSYVANKRARGENLGQRETAQAKRAAAEVMEAFRKTYGDQMRDIGSDRLIVDDSDSYESQVEEMRPQSANTLRNAARARLRYSLDVAESQVAELSRVVNSPQIAEVQSKLFDANQLIDRDFAAASQEIRSSTDSLRQVIKSSGDSLSERQRRMSSEAIEMVEIGRKEAEALDKEKAEDSETGEQEESEEGLPELEEL